jgi:transferase CAF17, mitochondrial
MNRLFSLNLTRSLIRCAGAKTETSQFLQGLITNDINHLTTEGNSSIYALFLSRGGRVLYDSIIYKLQSKDADKDEYLIECDTSVVPNLTKHLKLYRVRKKIDITLSDEHDLWCIDGKSAQQSSNDELKYFPDPRLKQIGSRIIAAKGVDVKNILKSEEASNEDYISHRYQLGICEGIIDLPPDKALPLESNCDYMHGVSFHKGCYIGQELTARTHHTGVIRKRLMPLFFENVVKFQPDDSAGLKDEGGNSLGKVRNVVGKVGLGLVRIEKAMAAKEIKYNENILRTEKPSWWPVEADKNPQIDRK